MEERVPCKHEVAGSIPVLSTTSRRPHPSDAIEKFTRWHRPIRCENCEALPTWPHAPWCPYFIGPSLPRDSQIKADIVRERFQILTEETDRAGV